VPRHRIEAIRKDHDRHAFDCGHPFLNEYLAQFARQNHRNGTARAYVLVPEGDNPVVGYYTLSAGAVAFANVPDAVRRRLPKYPLPVARIGELAVDQSHKGEGLGATLLIDAFQRLAAASESVAVWAVVVDPIDHRASSFYQHFGFESFIEGEALFLTMRDVKSWLG
jgi:GNAT superfamily N-acetyltransferase